MTTKFTPPNWVGKTVVVLAGGPSFNVPLAESLRAHITLAVNYVAAQIPWANAMLALDSYPDMWQAVANFEGLRMCGVQTDEVSAMYVGPMYERVSLAPGNDVFVRNSGLAAIRMAAQCGAAKIILVGFDPETQAHTAGYPTPMPSDTGLPYPNMSDGLASIVASLRSSGVVVEFAQPLPTTTKSTRPKA